VFTYRGRHNDQSQVRKLSFVDAHVLIVEEVTQLVEKKWSHEIADDGLVDFSGDSRGMTVG